MLIYNLELLAGGSPLSHRPTTRLVSVYDSVSPGKLNFAGKIGAALREQRLFLNLSQDELAQKAETYGQHISAIELGKKDISVTTLERLCRVLQIEPWQLLKKLQ